MANARVKIGHISGKRGISMANAKRYYYDKLDANARGERLTFHKWKKTHLSFSNAEGDGSTSSKLKTKAYKIWLSKGGKAIIIGGVAVVVYMLWKKFK